jgi:hypothetical protein
MRDVGESEMTIATLEKKLKPLESPVDNDLLRWLYLHLPPQPIRRRKRDRESFLTCLTAIWPM